MPSTPLDDWLQWLESSSWSLAIRQSTWMYPALEIVHIVGIVLLVGPAFLFDLRLLGVSVRLPVTELEHHLLTWSRRALMLVIPSGLLLFITNAVALAYNPVFHTKLILILVAGLNVLLFHKIIYRTVSGWNIGAASPAGAKITALVSMVVWIAVIACGRLLAY